MNEKLTSNNIQNDEFLFDKNQSDYKNLIIRLKEINLTIGLLKKQYLDKV